MRTLRGLRPLTLTLTLCLTVAACSGDDGAAPAPTTTTTSPVETTSTAPPATSVPAFDCGPVTAAQQQLDDAFADELSRLDIGRGDPRAQSVYALVTTTQGPEYYSAVLAAAPPELGDDARTVLDYYQQLADRVGTVDTGDGSTEALTAAMTRLDEATAGVDDPTAGTAVVQAQERLQVAVGQACSGDTPAASATASPTGSDPATATGSSATTDG